MGEKIYNNKYKDGREIIRKKIRKISNLWDNFYDDMKDEENKIEKCLMKFDELNL
jgi:hypothetical protein